MTPSIALGRGWRRSSPLLLRLLEATIRIVPRSVPGAGVPHSTPIRANRRSAGSRPRLAASGRINERRNRTKFRTPRLGSIVSAVVLATGLSCAPTVSEAQARTERISGQSAIEDIFLIGLDYLDSGNPGAAIEIFGFILARDPSLARVRLELARAYFLAEEYGRSRREFFVVLSGDLPDPVRANVLRFIRQIDARRGFERNLNVGFGTVGSRRNYRSDTIYLRLGPILLPFTQSREQTAQHGLRISGDLSLRWPTEIPLGDYRTVAYAGAAFQADEGPGSKSDFHAVIGRAGIRALNSTSSLSFGPIVSARFAAGEHYESGVGVEARIERRNRTGGSFFGNASHTRIDNVLRDDSDGSKNDVELGFQRSFSGQGSFGASVYAERKNVPNVRENYIGNGIRVFGTLDARYGYTFRPSAFLEYRKFGGLTLIEGNPNERSMGVLMKVEKNDVFFWNGLTPYLEASYARTDSGVAAFSYDESSFGFGLESRF